MTTARTSRISAEVLAEGEAKARTSRVNVEALVSVPSKARLSRLNAEALVNFPASARLSRLAVEVLVSNNVLLEREAADNVPLASMDDADSHIAWTTRFEFEAIPEPTDAAETTLSGYRTAVDSAGVTDAATRSVFRSFTSGETVPEPTDAATFVIHKFYVRTAEDILPTPRDRVTHRTRLAAFAQPAGSGVRLKRVLPNEARSYLTKVNTWSADVAISRPVPYSEAQPVLVDMGGFGFTTGGIAVNLSEDEEDAAFGPYFAPQGVA